LAFLSDFSWFWGGRSVVSSLKWALLTERLWNWVHKTQQH
jgi:hypothetical protein